MSRNFKLMELTVDEVLEEREKSWKIRMGDTTTFLAKSTCEQGENENDFLVPNWLGKKIIEAADRRLIKAA